ncbi:BSD domain-containing protein 1 [Physocladia obscura]|uniref:BSD domain-containing protein 1 n=1 Tax=Physocladia obscura TaxID=109957 RepID=A0AAD5XEP8_9FUNG|nr:BSD domain-containing protein 1 [Physocladia obscura]
MQQTEAVANLAFAMLTFEYYRDINEFITIVPPSEGDEQPPQMNENDAILSTSTEVDPDTGVVHTAVSSSTADSVVIANISTAVGDFVDRAEDFLDNVNVSKIVDKVNVSKIVDSVAVAQTVEKIELLADKAEDFLESVETGVWNFMSNAISTASSMIPTNIISGSTGKKSSSVPKGSIIFDRKTATVITLRHAESTYLDDPSQIFPSANASSTAEKDQIQRFFAFKENFEISAYKVQISRLFDDDIEIRGLLAKLVPSAISYDEFWLRYFFKISEVDREEEMRKKLMNDADLNNEEFDWDATSEEEKEDEKAETATIVGKSIEKAVTSAPHIALPSKNSLMSLEPVTISEAVAVVERNKYVASPVLSTQGIITIKVVEGDSSKKKSPVSSDRESSFDEVSDDKRGVESLSEEGLISSDESKKGKSRDSGSGDGGEETTDWDTWE